MISRIEVGDIVKIKEGKEYFVYSGTFRPNSSELGGYEYLCYSFVENFKCTWLSEYHFDVFLQREDDPTFEIGDQVLLRSAEAYEFEVVGVGKDVNGIDTIDVEYQTKEKGMYYKEKKFGLPAPMFKFKTKLS
jgi:hypothetical protein